MPGVYLYVLDTLRSDFVGSYNPDEPNTPNLDRLSNDGVRFTNAVVQATFTKLSAPSLLTGLYPVALGLYPKALGIDAKGTNFAIPPTISTLATLFKDAGFHTSAFSAHPLVVSKAALRRGFDVAPDMYEEPRVKEREDLGLAMAKRFNRKRKPPAIVTSEDLHASRRSRSGEAAEDEFMLIWAMDVHAPLFDRDRIDELTLDDPELINTVGSVRDDLPLARKLYRQMIAYADRKFGDFIEELKANGKYDESTIIVTSDHGESFGERKMYGHGGFPYESQINVPLIVKYPQNEHAGQISDKLVGLIDIVPTLAGLHKLSLSNDVHGQDLSPVVRGASSSHQHLIVHCPTLDKAWDCIAYRTESMKYIACSYSLEPTLLQRLKNRILWGSFSTDVRHVFDLHNDPGEHRDLIRSGNGEPFAAIAKGEIADYERMVQEYFEVHVGDLEVTEIDERVNQRLADLGYLE